MKADDALATVARSKKVIVALLGLCFGVALGLISKSALPLIAVLAAAAGVLSMWSP